MKNYLPFAFIGLTLIALKLFEQITWDWWIVTAPFYVPVVLAVLLIIGMWFYMVIHGFSESIFDFFVRIWEIIRYGKERN